MIDDIKIQSLLDKIAVAQEMTNKTYNKFSEILFLISDFATTVNGNPAKSVELLNEINKKIDILSESACNMVTPPQPTNTKNKLSFYNYLLIFFLVLLGSSIGSILTLVIFR